MYGAATQLGRLEWSWARDQLRDAGSYWLVPSETPSPHPHPRPVWGVWTGGALCLSVGSPTISAAVGDGQPVTVHLPSDMDVVILEGIATGSTGDPEVIGLYNAKYGWDYTVEEYGPLARIAPVKVIAWRSAGWAGRGGFQQAGRWRFGS